ncbi:hypothetical protein GCM10011585_34270 [Edaphobacter dinghuensis]|uniref:Uncharacterized protein n=1 Tax=Edaphobacter dinghuensis TaxID=1560005 RepID=A0A917MA16_9BACT|nr:hypothetical protein GCM10011585_34270 [Edaphobacter dinghuensis]
MCIENRANNENLTEFWICGKIGAMKITSRQYIAGYPALQIQKFIRRYRFKYIDRSEVRKYFNLSPRKATAFLDEMANLGYLTLFSSKPNGKSEFEVNTHGQALADACTAKPITREEADRILDEFMNGVHEVNADDEYAFKVTCVAVFGSMLTKDKDLIDEVEVAIQVAPATSDFQKFKLLSWFRRHVSGRRFETEHSWTYWPKIEIFLELRCGLENLSLHEFRELHERKDTPYRILYGDPKEMRKEPK